MTSPLVEQLLQNLNSAWLNRDYARLAALYHPDVVLLPPDAGAPLLGREAVLDTYRDFHAACRVEHFSVTEQSIWPFTPSAEGSQPTPGLSQHQVHGAITTMVHMRFHIDYRFKQGTQSEQTGDALLHSEQGLDVYTLTQATLLDDPKIIWRAQFTL